VLHISLQLLFETFFFPISIQQLTLRYLRSEMNVSIDLNIHLFLSAFNHNWNMPTQFGIKGSACHMLLHWLLAKLILRS
jgi:hypothetical protein